MKIKIEIIKMKIHQATQATFKVKKTQFLDIPIIFLGIIAAKGTLRVDKKETRFTKT
jgi:hypothetical protein